MNIFEQVCGEWVLRFLLHLKPDDSPPYAIIVYSIKCYLIKGAERDGDGYSNNGTAVN